MKHAFIESQVGIWKVRKLYLYWHWYITLAADYPIWMCMRAPYFISSLYTWLFALPTTVSRWGSWPRHVRASIMFFETMHMTITKVHFDTINY